MVSLRISEQRLKFKGVGRVALMCNGEIESNLVRGSETSERGFLL